MKLFPNSCTIVFARGMVFMTIARFQTTAGAASNMSMFLPLRSLRHCLPTSVGGSVIRGMSCFAAVPAIEGFVQQGDRRNSYSLTRKSSRKESFSDYSSMAESTTETKTTCLLDTKNRACYSSMELAASRLGLDPTMNRFHAPIVSHENYSFPDWPSSHTFPMDKFSRLAHALATTCKETHPTTSNLPRPLVRKVTHFYRPLDLWDIPRAWLAEPTRPIASDFLDRFLGGELDEVERRHIGFRDQTPRHELIERTVLEVAGTILAAQLAYRYGIASNAAGGTHHAHRDGGAGYTILNDLAIAANFLTDESLNGGTVRGVRKVLVVDCDVHQGDGTAKFVDLARDGRLATLSIHCASNYPRLKARSTYDVGLPDGCRDDEYMQVLEKSVNRALEEVRPDFVLYDAGVDVYEKDKLGRLKISEKGIRRRDRWVLDKCASDGIPVAAVIGGGYDKDVDALARRHAIVHEECAYVWRKHRMWQQ